MKNQELMPFYAHQGLYRFKRLVMGAGPASQEFHEKFCLSLQGFPKVIQIQDDVLIHAKSQEDH